MANINTKNGRPRNGAPILCGRNAVVRAHTWAVGQAMGWPRWVPPLSSIVEAGIVGLSAGIIGATLGAAVGDALFGVIFRADLWATAVLVLVLSGIASSVPAVFVLSRRAHRPSKKQGWLTASLQLRLGSPDQKWTCWISRALDPPEVGQT